MLRVERRVQKGTPTDVLSLPYDDRKKSRLRARSEGGYDVAIVLERGSSLRDGDLLAADNGEIFVVRAAAEDVSDATTSDAVLLAKAAYHLGNRHVPLQIELAALRYQRDHVLDDMVQALGLQVTLRTAAFEPEGGAYHGAGSAVHSHGEDLHGHDKIGRHTHSHGPGEPSHEH
jgi:urease accessory protein